MRTANIVAAAKDFAILYRRRVGRGRIVMMGGRIRRGQGRVVIVGMGRIFIVRVIARIHCPAPLAPTATTARMEEKGLVPAPCVQLVNMDQLDLFPLQMRHARHVAPGSSRQ